MKTLVMTLSCLCLFCIALVAGGIVSIPATFDFIVTDTDMIEELEHPPSLHPLFVIISLSFLLTGAIWGHSLRYALDEIALKSILPGFLLAYLVYGLLYYLPSLWVSSQGRSTIEFWIWLLWPALAWIGLMLGSLIFTRQRKEEDRFERIRRGIA